jgi:N-acetyl-anhydromuramyl-L-alanine amidase AmpD
MGEMRDFQALARYHVEDKDYPAIGYHYGVSPEGHIYQLLRHDLVRAYHIDAASKAIYSDWSEHILNREGLDRPSNHNSIGIVMPGDFSNSLVPPAQWGATVELCSLLITEHENAQIIGHRDVPGSERQAAELDCPGIFFDMTAFISEVKGRTISDMATPEHIRKYHALIKRLKESGNQEAVKELMGLRRHIRYV